MGSYRRSDYQCRVDFRILITSNMKLLAYETTEETGFVMMNEPLYLDSRANSPDLASCREMTRSSLLSKSVLAVP